MDYLCYDRYNDEIECDDIPNSKNMRTIVKLTLSLSLISFMSLIFLYLIVTRIQFNFCPKKKITLDKMTQSEESVPLHQIVIHPDNSINLSC
jgi:hypothetical protein